MKAPHFWRSKNLLSDLLRPVGWLFGAAARFRRSRARPEKLSVPVICVGNATLGGAGKTPTCLYIAERLKAQGIRAFFVTRGYGGALRGPLMVDAQQHTAAMVGDEALLLSRSLPTVVSAKRLEAAKFAIAQGAQAVILDDGLQNPTLEKDFSLLVIDGTQRFGNGHVFPAGPLRELPEAAMARADAILWVDAPTAHWQSTTLPQYHARTCALPLPCGATQRHYVAFCGIGVPEKFFATARAQGFELVETVAFADHHPYSEGDAKHLLALAGAHEAGLLTTAKDAVRLPRELAAKTQVLHITFEVDRALSLDQQLLQAVERRG